jgi:acyl-CoA synthetase (AMP-forming)/AMP-acid ligase II
MNRMIDAIHQAARRYGDAVAVVDGRRQLTFKQLERRTNQLSNALIALAGGTGARVAVLLPNRQEWLETDVAVLKAAHVKVPVNGRLSADEREYILAHSQSQFLITDGEGLASLEEARERLPDLEHVLVVGEDADSGRPYEATLGAASDAPPGVQVSPSAPSAILYTSGTTGRPKGATSSFRGRWAATLAMLGEELDVRPGDGMVHAGGMAHGSGSKSLAFLVRGARNILMPKFDGEAFLDLVERERATNSFLVPTMIASLVEAAGARRAEHSSLRTLTYGGAPITESLLLEAIETFGNVFVQVYGSCEAPHPISILTKADHLELTGGRARSIGRPVAGVELTLHASGSAEDDGRLGEMLVRGERIMSGYWNDPEATEAAFVDGWYRTGDVARVDDDGYYSIVDRQREMIISGGLNVYPAEVERVLSEHPAVRDVAVVGIPDERWGESVTAFVVLGTDDRVSHDELIGHCRTRLAGYKKPRVIVFCEALPKGSTGKILKRELREPYWAERGRMVN